MTAAAPIGEPAPDGARQVEGVKVLEKSAENHYGVEIKLCIRLV